MNKLVKFMNTIRLPVIPIFLEALLLPIKHFSTLLKYIIPFFIIVGFIFISSMHFFDFSYGIQPNFMIVILFFLAFIITLAIMAIGSHRTFLGAKSTETQRWFVIVPRYIGGLIALALCSLIFSLGIALVQVILSIMIAALGDGDTASIINTGFMTTQSISLNLLNINGIFIIFISLLGEVLLGYMLSRYLLILPAKAMDSHQRTLSDSWNLSRGNGWRLMILVNLIPALMGVIFALLMISIGTSAFSILVMIVIILYTSIITIGLLSLSYQFLLENNAAENLKEAPIMADTM